MDDNTVEYSAQDPFGRATPVWVFDDLTVKPGCQQRVLDLITQTYRPLAAARQLEFVDLWLLPPFERPDAPADIVVLWRYPSLDQLWRVRGEEEGDGRLVAYWAALDGLVEHRSRRLGRPPAMMNGYGPVSAAVDVLAPAAPTARFARQFRFVTAEPTVSGAQRKAWIAAPGAGSVVAAPYEPNSFMPGSLFWETFADVDGDPAGRLPAGFTASESVTPGPVVAQAIGAPELAGARRIIFFRTVNGLTETQRRKLERALTDVPRHIPAIRNWRLSRVANSDGNVAWSHCFEQEVADAAVFNAEYLNHPFHWAVVDRLFHPESHERMADRFGQVIHRIGRSAVAATAG